MRRFFQTACLCILAPLVHAAPSDSLSRTVAFPSPRVEVTAEGLSSVAVAGCEPDVRTALPVLPVQGASFEIPAGREVAAVTVTPLDVHEIPLAAPVQWGQPPRVPGAPPPPVADPDPAVYGGHAPYPDYTAPVWRVDPTGTGALLSVALHPVRYDPARNLLLAAETLEVTVELRETTDDGRQTKLLTADCPLPTAHCSYLVISTSNLIHNAPGPWNLQTLCAARARSGFTTGIVDVAWIDATYPGTSTPMRVRAFLQDAHSQWGVRYLLIAGTFDLIPAQKLYVSFSDIFSTITDTIPADAIYYGCLDGPFDGNGNGRYGEFNDGANGGDVDLTAEVMVGRFPVANAAELAHMVRKTLRHESAAAAELAPNGFIAEKMNLGSLVYATGFMEELRLGTNTYALASMGYETSPYADAFDTAHTLYDSDARLWNAKDALDFFNRDYLTINHIGHGAVKTCAKISLANADYQAEVAAFTNSLPWFIYSQACDTGAFDTPDCFAEQIVTVSNAASAAVMNARDGWEYTSVVGGYSHRYHRCFWDAALRGTATRLGEINELSRRMNLHLLVPYAANYWRYVHYELNLFGDPATPFAPAINTVLPEIAHEPLINTYDTQTVHRVACTLEPVGIYDPDAVALVWRTDRDPALVHTQAMTQVTGNLFEGFIDPQPADTRVAYAIVAANRAGFTNRFPAADDAVFHVTERLDLDIRGSPLDAGTVAPAYGITHFASGLVASASAPLHVPVADGTRLTCTGFSGSGSAPQSGTDLAATFRMDGHSLLLWLWRREHRLTLSSANAAFPTQHLWAAENSLLAVPAAPPVLTDGATAYAFAEWRLDGARAPAAPGTSDPAYGGLAMDAPHALEAVYLPADLDADGNGIPDWWEFRHYGTRGLDPESDDDGDGYTLAEEFADRSSPLSPEVFPAPPAIVHTPLAETQTRPGPFTIQARITDTHAVASAEVLWRRRTGSWQSTAMAPLSNDLFTAEIGALSAPGDDFEYQIVAADPSGDTAYSAPGFFFLRYPVADTSRFHDLAVVALPTQSIVSTRMDLHNTGNVALNWTPRFARRETVTSTNLPAWDWTTPGQSWVVSTNRVVSPPYALHGKLVSRRLPNTPERATVTFPPTLLGPDTTLSFKHWIHSELDTADPTRAFDGGIVEISIDDGATFQQLRGPYTHTIYGWAASPWPDGTPCFAGGATGGWRTVTFDLAALYPEQNGFSGRTVLFRFHYGGDNNTDLEGWYIDDVTVAPLLWQNGFAHDIEPSYTYTIPAGDYKRIFWSNFPVSMALRDDNITVLIESNDPADPLFSFDWAIKIRDLPRLPGLAAAQTASGDGVVNLTTGVADSDGESVALAVQWSADNGKTWRPAALTDLVADFGEVPAHSATGAVAALPTAHGTLPATNHLAAAWASRDVLPAIGVSTQMLFRVTADNGYFRAAYTTGRFTVDNVPPVFLPGPLAAAPLSAVGPYAITDGPLTLAWPAATDNPSTNLTYRLTALSSTNLTAATSAALSLSNALDAVHTFRVVALDPAGNASAPLEATLLVLDPLGDTDGDGMTAAAEETAGTDATDASDRLAAALSRGTGALALTWSGVASRLYTVETTPTLQPPDWHPLPDAIGIPGTGAPLSVEIPVTAPSSFFRITVTRP
jgi:hypothetical protein